MSGDKPKFKVRHHHHSQDEKHKHHHPHDQDHEHGHGHDHDEHHQHSKANSFSNAFKIGIILNLIFTLIEFTYGILSHSLALIADAGHNLSDVLGLAIAFVATILIKRKANQKFTFGLRGSTILSALFNSIFLFLAVGAIFWEAIHRFNSVETIQTNTMMIVAAVGIIINFTTAMLFHTHSHDDLNAKGAFLHLLGDAVISLGVVIAGLAIKFTGFTIIDPIISIIISLVIVYNTWSLFKEALFLTLNAVPEKINMDELVSYLTHIEGVESVHDLHVWAISTNENALTAHLILPNGISDHSFLRKIEQDLKVKFKIQHTTIQTETKICHDLFDETCFKL
jgi:cobalt-zinc-cadmium efflux system protein